MIQRIQTLFLLAASALLFSMFFGVMASNVEEKVYFMENNQILILNLVTFLLSFVTIFFYRYRMIQIRVSIFNSIILLAYQGWLVWLIIKMREPGTSFSILSVFPLIAMILVIMAVKYIARDEAIVRSVSRLRKSKGAK